jgi:uncharacterized membrane protein YbhN (UPF0104 family)
VGGDAYKIYFLNKHYGLKTKESFWPFLMDRGSGMFAILVLMLICAYFIDIPIVPYKNLVVTLLILAGFGAVYFIVKLMKKDHLKTFFTSMHWSFWAQASQAYCIYLLIDAIGIHEHLVEYIFLFFVSSIATIIPITPGGAGLRELTFKHGLPYFGLDTHIGIFIGTLTFIITAFISFFGIYYHFKRIKTKENTE